MTKDKKKFVREFEYMRNMAELKALSKVSLERPLTDSEYKRIMELKEKVLTPKQKKALEGNPCPKLPKPAKVKILKVKFKKVYGAIPIWHKKGEIQPFRYFKTKQDFNKWKTKTGFKIVEYKIPIKSRTKKM